MVAFQSRRLAQYGVSEPGSVSIVIASHEEAGVVAGFFMSEAIQRQKRLDCFVACTPRRRGVQAPRNDGAYPTCHFGTPSAAIDMTPVVPTGVWSMFIRCCKVVSSETGTRASVR